VAERTESNRASCIFCDQPFGPGGRKRSREHAFPRWIAEELGHFDPAPHYLGLRTPEGTTVSDYGTRSPFTTTVRDVCEVCNTGWMAELETGARPILAPLIRGEPRKLKFWRQTVAATWATKTAMTLECLIPLNRGIPPEYAHGLRAYQCPPLLRQQVWIGRYSGGDPHCFGHSAGRGGERTPGGPNPQDEYIYNATLTVGELAFQIFGHTFKPRLVQRVPDDLASSLVQIWPPADEVVAWPPQSGLDNGALERLVDSIGRLPDEPS
jgi:hypothetical protein